jgi:hypothetical protein
MLLQTNSYVVPRHQRTEHARLLTRFKQALARVGCDLFEVYEQTDADWNPTQGDGRFVQIMRFRDRAHQQAIREAERLDLHAQSLIEEFCQLINFPYQKEHGLFAVGFYSESEGEQCGAKPSPGTQESASGDAELARVLDSGLEFDDLDIPMEAELLDDEALEETNLNSTSSSASGPLLNRKP